MRMKTRQGIESDFQAYLTESTPGKGRINSLFAKKNAKNPIPYSCNAL